MTVVQGKVNVHFDDCARKGKAAKVGEFKDIETAARRVHESGRKFGACCARKL